MWLQRKLGLLRLNCAVQEQNPPANPTLHTRILEWEELRLVLSEKRRMIRVCFRVNRKCRGKILSKFGMYPKRKNHQNQRVDWLCTYFSQQRAFWISKVAQRKFVILRTILAKMIFKNWKLWENQGIFLIQRWPKMKELKSLTLCLRKFCNKLRKISLTNLNINKKDLIVKRMSKFRKKL